MLRTRADHNRCANITVMPVNSASSPATHFGRQMRKERQARGWSLREFSARTGINFGSASQIENGKRQPTETIAAKCDEAFPERRGWFMEYYEESKSWLPPGLRSWAEHEDKAVRLEIWSPGIIHGLFQTEEYARVFIAALPGVTGEVAAARLASRIERQRRVLMRDDDPPQATYVIDHAALYRCVGTPLVMAEQMAHLAEMAALPNITMQVLPAVAHPATASELMIADNNAAYAEHLAAGGVYTEDDTVTRLERIFASIRGESYRVSESVAIIRRAGETWTAGASPVSVGPTVPA